MRESEKIKGLISSTLVIRWLKIHQPRLRWMNGQTKPVKAFGEHFHDPTGIIFPLESNNKIVRKADEKTLTLHSWLSILFEPDIKDVMQVDVG